MSAPLYLAASFGAGFQGFSNAGVVLSGGKLYTYVAGSTSTLQPSYSDSTGNTQLANPIILDSTGRPTTEIWIALNTKFVLHDANDNPLSNASWDFVPGVNNISISQSQWILSGLATTYLSATQFSVPGNQTTIFTVGQRILYKLGGGTYYGYVSASSFDGIATTTVTIVPDITNLDNTLYEVDYSFLSSLNLSVPQNVVATQINQATAKAVPIAADKIGYWDSVPGLIKSLTFTNLWTWITTTFLNNPILFVAAGGAADAYILAFSTAVTALANGMRFSFATANTNVTTTPTAQISALAAKTIVNKDGTALFAGQITAFVPWEITYNSNLDKFMIESNVVHSYTLTAEQATTSGTSIDFTGIPAWATKIYIHYKGVSTSGTSPVVVQIGPAGGVENSGYLGSGCIAAGTAVSLALFTPAFGTQSSGGAGSTRHGRSLLSLENAANFTWCFTHTDGLSDTAIINWGSGVKSCASALSRVRITTAGGTETFDAGAISIAYE